jgi:hypothetical protein
MSKTADYWLQAIHDEFYKESDRAAGIVAAAMLDDALRVLIEKLLVPTLKDSSLTSNSRGPLSTFSARIDAAQQLGLISAFLARDLHLIRKIRNRFAHESSGLGFDDQKIGNWVTALEKGSDYNTRNPKTRTDIGPPGPRWDFLCICAWMLYAIHRETESVTPLKAQGPEFGYIPWERIPKDIMDRIAEPPDNSAGASTFSSPSGLADE